VFWLQGERATGERRREGRAKKGHVEEVENYDLAKEEKEQETYL
jgi:hypothetical protein